MGADTSPDDGSWEAWKPTTGETAIESFDGPYQYNTTDSGLVSYWPMDETANDSCSGGQDACDRKGSYHGTATGTTIIDGRYGKGRYFNGSNDYLSIADTSALDPGTGDYTIEAWIKTTTTADSAIYENGNGTDLTLLRVLTGTGVIRMYNSQGANEAYRDSSSAVNDGRWHHVVTTWVGSTDTINIYIDGVLNQGSQTTSGTLGSIAPSNIITIGRRSAASSMFFPGTVDEVRIYTSALSASTIQQHYLEGTTRPETLHPLTDSTYKLEGNASQKIETGRPLIDGNTVALWHLDETGGSGAYIKDSTANANHLTPTGTSVSQGFTGKARSFSGGSEYLREDSISPNLSGDLTIQTWFKTSTLPGVADRIFDLAQASAVGLQLYISTNGYIGIDNSGGPTSSPQINVNHADGKWHHAAITRSGTTYTLYVDGVSIGTSGGTAPTYTNIYLARRWDNETYNWQGIMDETKISSVAFSAEEIAEAYRAGRDHYINKTITSTDLSAKTTLPFYVAADRPGTYLQATVGESAHANYQPDANTVGLWHMEEQSGSGAYVRDSSGKGNHGTPTGTTFSQGKIGKARYFDNSNDVVDAGSNSSFNFGNNGPFTHSGWINPTTLGDYDAFVSKVVAARNGTYSYMTVFMANGRLSAYNTTAGWVDICPAGSVTTNQWQHVAFAYNGTTIYGYVNGRLCGSAAFVYTDTTTHNIFIGSWYVTTQLYDFNGYIDEVTVSNNVRTANEIRQAYEVGLRTHPVTIDFGAKLDSGNLITGSGDLGFTVDATYYGLQNKGDQLFKGDKIIVRENYDGTEYIAQGTVTAVTASTGAVTVAAWDAGSTFPGSGYTANASVFKWQREYFAPTGSLSTHRDAITNLTIRLTNGAEGRTIWLDDLKSNSDYLTTPGGSTITSSTGNRYFQYRIVNTSNNEAVSPTVTAVTLDYTTNSAPATPTLDVPTDTATNQVLLPALKTTATDAQSDYLRYKIELCTNLAMTQNCQTFDQTASQTGWSGQNTQGGTAYTSGTQATYTLQSALSAATTYYWRSYAIDPGGTNTWSSTQSSPYSFTTESAPTMPSALLTETLVNPVAVTDTTPEFSAICNDPDTGDIMNKYRIQVAVSTTFGSPVWD